MLLYIALFFSVVVLALVILQFWPKTTINAEQPFVFPLLAMAAIDMVALLAPQPVNLLYKGAILLGLALATLAVVFYHLPKMPRYVGASHFIIVYFLYFIAFSSANHIAIPSPILLLIAAYAFLVYWYAREHVKEQWGAFIAYIVMMSFMVWTASEAWVQHSEVWATMTFAGALLLVFGDTLMLVNGIRMPKTWLRIVGTVAFYSGHLLIAWSIWGIGIAIT